MKTKRKPRLLDFLWALSLAAVVGLTGCGTASKVGHTGGIPNAKAETIDLGGGVEMEFVLIRSGSFVMGSEFEKPAHRVTITKPFYMGKYEVTQEQWQTVMGNNPSRFKGSKLPVERVSWKDCQSFLARLEQQTGRRFALPTEAEWEYACRAGRTNQYCFGDASGKLGDYAWYEANGDSKPHPVGTRKPNAWGLYDMHGNVWEWCADWYGDYLPGEVADPQGPGSGSVRVLRGGCSKSDEIDCRTACRTYDWPFDNDFYDERGFRVVLTPSR